MLKVFHKLFKIIKKNFPGGLVGKESTCNGGDLGSILGLEDPLEKKWQPTPIFLPEESLWRNLADYIESLRSQRVGQH